MMGNSGPCDICEMTAELYHNERTGLALCEDCDMKNEGSEEALTSTTTYDDGKFVRTALVVGEGTKGGSVAVVTPSGKFLGLLNVFAKEDWLAVDVIDTEEQFESRRGLVFEDGSMRDMETTGNLVAVDFRMKEEGGDSNG